MAYKPPTTPTSDPMQKGPILQGANDKEPYVGKPKPMPPTPKPPQRPVYGSSDGSGFDFAKWQAGQHRPRPTQILPGQGQGPMPVGTRPLPSPVVKDARGGGGPGSEQPPWLQGQILPMDIGPGSANERAQASLKAQWEAKNGPWQGSEQGGYPSGSGIRAMGDDLKGLQGQAGFGGGMQGQGGWNRGMPQPGTPEFEEWKRRMMMGGPGMFRGGDVGFGEDPNKMYGGGMQEVKPGGMGPGGQDPMYGGAGQGPSYGGPTQARDFNVPNYGAPVQRGPMQGPPPVGTGPGSMGKPRQPHQRDPWTNGGMQPMLPNEQNQAEAAVQQISQGDPRQWDPRTGSGYYGAF